MAKVCLLVTLVSWTADLGIGLAFLPLNPNSVARPKVYGRREILLGPKKTRASSADEKEEVGSEDEDPDEMRISEIKSELDLRGVKYDDVFEGRELRKRLKEARLSGKANPNIVDTFNRATNEIDITEEKIQAVKGADGTVPGGLKPEELQKLASNPDILKLMANPDFQKIMKEAMEGGPEALAKYENDPQVRELMKTAASLIQDAGLSPPSI